MTHIEQWRKFSNAVENFIKNKTNNEYGPDMTSGPPKNFMVCIWNILKYSTRNWNNQGKSLDCYKMAHYAMMADYYDIKRDTECASKNDFRKIKFTSLDDILKEEKEYDCLSTKMRDDR